MAKAESITREQAAAEVYSIKLATLLLHKETARFEDRVTKAREELAAAAGETRKRILESTRKLKKWAQANPEEFDEKRSIEFAHGVVGWRKGQWYLDLADGLDDVTVIARLEAFEMSQFVRIRKEIDAEKLIAQRADPAIATALPKLGISIEQGEKFYCEPKLEQPGE